MDIEQLKLVLSTLQGHDASSLVILWLWLKFGAGVLCTLFWGAILIGAVVALGKAYRAVESDQRSDRFIRDMRDILCTGTGGCMTDSERDRTQALLRSLADAYNAQQKQKP